MNKTIWKYPIDRTDDQVIRMPLGAQVLCIQVQCGTPCIWALVDPKAECSKRNFKVFETGRPVPDEPLAYIGTFQSSCGSFVFHLFEGV